LTRSAVASTTTIAAASAQGEAAEKEEAATKTIVANSDCWTAGSEKRMTTMSVEVEERCRWARIENYDAGPSSLERDVQGERRWREGKLGREYHIYIFCSCTRSSKLPFDERAGQSHSTAVTH
jgi:hypothetical protein